MTNPTELPPDPYLAIAACASSSSLTSRVTACASQQNAPGDPVQWAWDNRYGWASTPGWGAAWASAEAAGNEDPGADPAVITDGMILAQVQVMLTPPVPPEVG